MATLYLHIGTHKTGSTSLQHYLYEHRAALARQGLHYPEIGLKGSGHHALAWAFGSGFRHEPDTAQIDAACEHISRLLAQGEDVVVSSEEFEFLRDTAPLAPLAQLPQVKIVLYVRRQDDMLESTYAQHVAQYSLRYAGSIYQFCQRHDFLRKFNYVATARRWGEVFGEDKVIVRPYGTALVRDDVCEDLLSLMGRDDLAQQRAAGQARAANPSLGARALRLLAHLNRLRLSEAQHLELQRHLRRELPPTPGLSLLHAEDAEVFYERFRHHNNHLFYRFLGATDNPFDTLTGRRGGDWLEHEQVDTRQLMDLVNQFLISAPTGDTQ